MTPFTSITCPASLHTESMHQHRVLLKRQTDIIDPSGEFEGSREKMKKQLKMRPWLLKLW